MCAALQRTFSRREKLAGRAFDRPIGPTKRRDRNAVRRIGTEFAFDSQTCYATVDRKQSSGESRLNARQIWETSGTTSGMRKLEELYARHEYLDAYAAYTDARVKADPHAAVGGYWEKMGKFQIDFLVRHGLDPKHTLLDIGCGTLRGGRHFIRFLDVGNYTGIDISQAAIEYAHRLVENEGLSKKNPRLMLNWEKSLRFSDLSKERFDFLFAQSVFTHLPRREIRKCFIGVQKIMHSESLFFFTFRVGDKPARIDIQKFQYPLTFFQNLASRHNFRLDDLSIDYPHPRGQAMALLRLGV